MNSSFDKNLAIIEEKHPQAYSKLLNMDNEKTINTLESKDGNKVPFVILNEKKIFIHSRFDPVKEAQRFISEIEADKYDIFIIFGFGFAYHIEELLQRIGTESILLIIEKNPQILKDAARYRNISNLLHEKRVIILIDPSEEEIAESLRGKSTRRISFITHRGSFQTDPEYYTNIRRITKSFLSTKDVNIATLSKFEKTWSSNITRNINKFLSCPGANIFYDKFNGVPAIVAAAGPSLSNSIEFIKANKKKAVIIAVDTSYKILQKNNIEPHFCITVDPQIINSRYFEGTCSQRTILIADPTVHPSVFRLFNGKAAITGTAFQMMKWIENVAGHRGELNYGGSVTTNAYDFAKRIGSYPVVLVGQDLAFTNGLAHARGSYLDEEIRLKQSRFYNMNMFNRYQLSVLPKIYIDSIDGKRIATNQKLMIFLTWFENRMDEYLINATQNGAIIKGVKHLTGDEINFENTEIDINSAIEDIYTHGKASLENSEFINTEILKRCGTMLEELETLMPNLERAVSLSLELTNLMKSRQDQGKIDYILKKLTDIDKMIKSMETLKDMIGFTIQRVIHTITEGYNIDEEDSILSDEEITAKKSLFLYRGLYEGSLFIRKILTKMVNLLNY